MTYDSDCMIMDPTDNSNKLYNLPHDLRLRLEQKPQPESIQHKTKKELDILIKMRHVLVAKATELDKSTTQSGDVSVLLKRLIPESVIVRIPKIEICGHFVNSWSVLRDLLHRIKLSREQDHDLGIYVSIMERAKESKDQNSKSIVLKGPEKDQGYLKDGGVKNPEAIPLLPKMTTRIH